MLHTLCRAITGHCIYLQSGYEVDQGKKSGKALKLLL
jgi:hypothetical protein